MIFTGATSHRKHIWCDERCSDYFNRVMTLPGFPNDLSQFVRVSAAGRLPGAKRIFPSNERLHYAVTARSLRDELLIALKGDYIHQERCGIRSGQGVPS